MGLKLKKIYVIYPVILNLHTDCKIRNYIDMETNNLINELEELNHILEKLCVKYTLSLNRYEVGCRVYYYSIVHSTILTSDIDNKVITTFGVDLNLIKSKVVALSELVERVHFYTIGSDAGQCSEREMPTKKYGYREVGLPIADIGSAELNEVFCVGGKWPNNELVQVPFEAFNAKRDCYRSTTSGWASQFGDVARFSSLSEFVERSFVLFSWYTKNLGQKIKLNGTTSHLEEIDETKVSYYLVSGECQFYVVVALGKSALDDMIYISSATSFNITDAIEKAYKGVLQKHIQKYGLLSSEEVVSSKNEGPLAHRIYYSSEKERLKLLDVFKAVTCIDIHSLNTLDCPSSLKLDKLCCILKNRGYGEIIFIDCTRKSLHSHTIKVIRSVVVGMIPFHFGANGVGRISNLKSLCDQAGASYDVDWVMSEAYHPFI